MDSLMNWWGRQTRTTKILIFGVLAVILIGCCLVAGGFSYFNNIWNEGVAKEKQLSAEHLDNQNYLSGYISGFYELAGSLEFQSEALDQILVDAVKGRYDEGGFAVDSPMFAAIVEAYPEAGVAELMANWSKFMDYIAAGREGFRAKQTKLIDEMRNYDTWRQTGLIRRHLVRMVGFPSENLEARVGEMVYTGEMARQKMLQIVLTSKAVEAYETGVMEPLEIPQSE